MTKTAGKITGKTTGKTCSGSLVTKLKVQGETKGYHKKWDYVKLKERKSK
jgi:hypothetical protein